MKFPSESLASEPLARQRFMHEAKAAAGLDHPFICKVYETGEDRGRLFIAMEYVEGETLADRLARGPLPLQGGYPNFTRNRRSPSGGAPTWNRAP